MNIQELKQRVNKNRENIDFEKLKTELKELEQKLQSPEVWSNQSLANELGAKSKEIKETIEQFERWDSVIEDGETALEIGDEELISESEKNLFLLEKENGGEYRLRCWSSFHECFMDLAWLAKIFRNSSYAASSMLHLWIAEIACPIICCLKSQSFHDFK